jgi:hypothetical protein
VGVATGLCAWLLPKLAAFTLGRYVKPMASAFL